MELKRTKTSRLTQAKIGTDLDQLPVKEKARLKEFSERKTAERKGNQIFEKQLHGLTAFCNQLTEKEIRFLKTVSDKGLVKINVKPYPFYLAALAHQVLGLNFLIKTINGTILQIVGSRKTIKKINETTRRKQRLPEIKGNASAVKNGGKKSKSATSKINFKSGGKRIKKEHYKKFGEDKLGISMEANINPTSKQGKAGVYKQKTSKGNARNNEGSEYKFWE